MQIPLSPARAGARRSLLSLTAVLLAAAALAGAPGLAGRASAGVVDAECLGSFARAFTPAVTATAQNVTAAATYTYSTCIAGSTGTGTATSTLSLSCLSLTAGPAETETITWQDGAGDTSTIAWSPPVISAQTVIFDGTVTAGLHAGDTAVQITSGTSYLGSVAQCLLEGIPISHTTGLVDTLTLTSA